MRALGSLDRVQWPLLEPLAPAERGQLLSTAHRHRYPRGHVICHAGDPADALHLVEAGRLTVQVSSPDGDVAVLNILGPGDYFGELALLRRDWPLHRTATVTTLEATETLAVARSEFEKLRARNPRVEQMLSWLLAEQVDKLSQRLLEALYLDVDQRVCLRLADLADTYRRENARGPITVPLTQEQLATLAGATRPTVNQVLRRLEERGIVTLGRGSIRIRDVRELRRSVRS
jgi:CRP-like cAMP-binding protein